MQWNCKERKENIFVKKKKKGEKVERQAYI